MFVYLHPDYNTKNSKHFQNFEEIEKRNSVEFFLIHCFLRLMFSLHSITHVSIYYLVIS